MLLLAAGLAGFAVLTLEVLGVHFLSPWFGASFLVWINQIGVVLLALALGGWLGGVRARSSPAPVRLAGKLLLGAGLLVGAAVLLLPLFSRWILPAEMRLDEAAVVFLGGSLGASLLFYAPPVLLMGMVAPLLVQARAEGRGAGKAAGEISAVGTLGSLVGVFGSSYLALPLLGAHLTLALTAAALVAAGALLLRARALPAGLAALLALAPGTLGDRAAEANLPAGAQVLAVADTPYQRLRVIAFPGPDGTEERWLQMNEGLDSFQSRWNAAGGWPGGYYDLFALAPLCAGAAETPGPFRAWLLGHGTGTAFTALAPVLAGRDWQATGVELDPAVVRLGNEWMPLPAGLSAHVQVVSGRDARSTLRAAPRDLDVVLLDAYARQFEIPLHLATEEFFAEVRDHLRPGGVLALNVGTSEEPGGPRGILGSLRAALARAFDGQVRAHRVPFSRNVVLFARKDRPLPSLEELADRLPAGLPRELGAALLPSAVLEGPPAGAPPRFTDDRNPLALAQARLWLFGADR